jgi:hypothetical protein
VHLLKVGQRIVGCWLDRQWNFGFWLFLGLKFESLNVNSTNGKNSTFAGRVTNPFVVEITDFVVANAVVISGSRVIGTVMMSSGKIDGGEASGGFSVVFSWSS